MVNTHMWISAPRRADRDRMRAGLDLPPALSVVDAHRTLRGPFTAAGTLMRLVAPGELRRRPDLARRHYIELQESTPELRGLVPPIVRKLEQGAEGPGSVSRYPARLHSLRVAHGLVDFLGEYLAGLEGPRTLVVENVHEADSTDREFLAVLLRRVPADRLTVVLCSGPGEPADPPGTVTVSLPAAIAAYTTHLAGEGAGDESPGFVPDEHDDALPGARAFVAADGTDEDPWHAAAYHRLAPEQRAALHDARADELEAAGEESLRLGAIPYHRTRGADPLGAGVKALLWAQERCRYLGFYHFAAELGEHGRALVDPWAHPAQWWELTKAEIVSLAAGGRAEEAIVLQDGARRLTQDPMVHMKLAYETAMVHTRHLPEPRRDHRLARAWVNQAIAFASVLEDPKERAFYSVFNRNGLALIETRDGNVDEAVRLLDEGMERLDRELDLGEKTWHRLGLLYNRAQVNTMSGRTEAALADYVTVMALDDSHADHYFNRGNILRRLGRVHEAIEDYTRALELEPPFPEAYYNRGDALLEIGEAEDALADFERVLELDPGHVDAVLNRAGILAGLGDLAAASAGVEAGLALAPGHPHLLCLRGSVLAEQGAADAAREALNAALRGDPALAEAWAVLGELDFAAGDLEAALADFDRAMRFGGGPAIRFNRAVVHEAAGRFAEAVADFDAVLAETDDDEARSRRDACRAAVAHADA